jgi:hypothetical protein
MASHGLLGLVGDLGLGNEEVDVTTPVSLPRACEPKRIPCVSGAAAARRRPASAIRASSTTLMVEIVVAAMGAPASAAVRRSVNPASAGE